MASTLLTLFGGGLLFILLNPITLAITVLQIWMFIHAVRNGEWIWAVLIIIGWGLTSIWYYLYVYRASASSVSGFELPGAFNRKRVRELQAQIHHIDNASHHFQLGDLYFQRGKLEEAEKCYRAALEREPTDIDARAHLGQCLVRLKRPAEARPILEGVMHEKPGHDYGYTMMALAEALTALGETDNTIQYWRHITQNHSYPRAKVQLAELYAAKNQPDLAKAELKDVLTDDVHAPAFQRRRDRVWINRARGLMKKL
jgi:hypothetical protein